MKRQNRNEDLEKKVLVSLPISDSEIFEHLLTGQRPAERPIKMSYEEYKSIRNFARAMLAGVLVIGVASYFSAIQESGSTSNAYEAFMQQVDKWPARMYTP